MARSKEFSPSAKPLGILGGGQLARMLALKAHELGIPVKIFCENADDPAAQVVGGWKKSSLRNSGQLEHFLQSCSVVTFESEFLDAELLATLAKKTGTKIFPDARHMQCIQDRLSQKELLLENKIPTAPHFAIASADDARKAFKAMHRQVVFKKRRFGYDGYGTFIVKNERELEAFIHRIDDTEFGFIAEEYIAFKREIAVMVARSRHGQTVRFPFVETFQENSRCLWVKGPLPETAKLKTLGRKLEKFLDEMGYVGVMGIELFETDSGKLIVNELAPRVHNSGHFSLDAMNVDQFTMHLKAIYGFELPEPKLRDADSGFAMWNLLGTTNETPSWELTPYVHLHWYGKMVNRPGRKMGHLNTVAKSGDEALKVLKKNRALFHL